MRALPPAIEFTLNGRAARAGSAPETPLLWVLREELGLTGTKFGCGRGLCGACTVHLNRLAVRSCQVTLGAAAGQRVTTIEGLSESGSHPLQVAWRELQVPQCGYCQSGQLMAAAALLRRTPRPSELEVAEALSGNLCRCGTYNRIRAAVMRASAVAARAGDASAPRAIQK